MNGNSALVEEPKVERQGSRICKRGHEVSGDNIRWQTNGYKLYATCKACSRQMIRSAKERRKEILKRRADAFMVGVVGLQVKPTEWNQCNRCHESIPEGARAGRWLMEHKRTCPQSEF